MANLFDSDGGLNSYLELKVTTDISNDYSCKTESHFVKYFGFTCRMAG